VICVGLLLVGIVFLNVRLLELDGRIARDSERVAALRHENADLRLRAAHLGSSERIQRAAAGHGLVWPRAGEFHFLRVRTRADAKLAAQGMVAPRAASESDVAREPEATAESEAATESDGPTTASPRGAADASASGAAADGAADAPRSAGDSAEQ
jgi:hypothetical protein